MLSTSITVFVTANSQNYLLKEPFQNLYFCADLRTDQFVCNLKIASIFVLLCIIIFNVYEVCVFPTKSFSLVLLLLLSVVSPLLSQTKHRYAISTITSEGGVSPEESRLIADRLSVELFRTGKATILERKEMNTILQEQGFQAAGVCDEQSCLVEMGQLLGVQSVIAGTIGKVGTLLMFNVRVIDVGKGDVTTVVSRDINGGIEGIVQLMPSIATELVGLEIPATSPSQSVYTTVPVVQAQTPIVQREETTYPVEVEMYNRKHDLFVDGKHYGKGDHDLHLPTGKHHFVEKDDGEIFFSDSMEVLAKKNQELDLGDERRTRFYLGASLTKASKFAETSSVKAMGVDFGWLISRKFRLGVTFHGNPPNGSTYFDTYNADGMQNDSTTRAYIGGFVVTEKVWDFKKIFQIGLGGKTGFRYYEVDSSDVQYDGEIVDGNTLSRISKDHYEWGGPSVSFALGYKFVYVELSLLNSLGFYVENTENYIYCSGSNRWESNYNTTSGYNYNHYDYNNGFSWTTETSLKLKFLF